MNFDLDKEALSRQVRGAYEEKTNAGDFGRQIKKFVKNISREQELYPVKIKTRHNPLNYRLEYEERTCYLHSLYDRQREMARMFAGIPADTEVLVLFGLGAGYGVEYAGDRFAQLKQVILVEPSLGFLTKALGQPEVLQRLTRGKELSFVWNRRPEDAAAAVVQQMRGDLKKKWAITFHLNYRSLYPGYYEIMQENILAGVRQTQMNIATVEVNFYYKTQNTIYNLTAASIDSRLFIDFLRDKPAIMVSAGPSLNKNMHLLNEAKEKAVVVAVGSAIRILHSNGIKPHIRAAFSPNPNESNVFHSLEEVSDIPLLYSNTLDYPIIRHYKYPKIRMVMDGDYLSQYYYKKAGIGYSLVKSGATIANVTFDFLGRSRCSKVILTGQDLAFPGKKMYAAGSWADISLEGQEAGLVRLRDIEGKEVFTSKAFDNIRRDFEQMAINHPQVQYINATEGGAPIKNIPNASLADCLADLPPLPDLDGQIQALFQSGNLQYEQENLDKALEEMHQEIEAILELNGERRQRVQDIAAQPGIKQRVKDLETLARYEERMAAVPFYREVVLPELESQYFVIKSSFNYEGEDPAQKEKSLNRIYQGIGAKLEEYLNFVREMLQERSAD